MNLEELYLDRCKGDKYGDINAHLPALRHYAELSRVVVEFGVRSGNSTIAFLAGGATVFSYDINVPELTLPAGTEAPWFCDKADTAKLTDIPDCDLLFLDSRHTEAQVRAELNHHLRVARWIILHDTIKWGSVGEGEPAEPGIICALFPFLATHNKVWRIKEHSNESNGLTVLERIQ